MISEKDLAESEVQPMICIRCVRPERVRIAVTVLEGNALCSICFMKTRPDIFSKEEVQKLERKMINIEQAQIARTTQTKDIVRRRANKPKKPAPDPLV